MLSLTVQKLADCVWLHLFQLAISSGISIAEYGICQLPLRSGCRTADSTYPNASYRGVPVQDVMHPGRILHGRVPALAGGVSGWLRALARVARRAHAVTARLMRSTPSMHCNVPARPPAARPVPARVRSGTLTCSVLRHSRDAASYALRSTLVLNRDVPLKLY